MSEPTQPKGNTQVRVVTRGLEPPLTLGPQRLHYQYSNVLPQAHLTFVSIVQGIAFGVLLQGWPIPERTDFTHLGAFMVTNHAYLPWIISALIIVVIWKQFVQSSLYTIWPLSSGRISLMLLIAVAEIVAFREIQHIYIWLAALGIVGIVGGCIRLSNIRIRIERDYELADQKRKDDIAQLIGGTVFITLGVLIAASSLALHAVPVLVQNAATLSWVALVLFVCIMIGVILFDANETQKTITAATKGSDLEYAPPGSIRYRAIPAQEEALAASALSDTQLT